MYVDEFVTSKLAANCSRKTITWYTWLLGNYHQHCADAGLPPDAPGSVDTFLASLRRAGNAPATLRAYHRALHSYFGWCVRRALMESNPVRVVEQPRLPRRRAKHVTMGVFDTLYSSIPGERWLDHRDRALLIVLFYSGLRVGEAVGLRLGDVDLGRHLVSVRSGKGGHDRIVPCAPLLDEPMRAYLDSRPAWKRPVLWLSSDGTDGVRGALTAEGVRVMLRRRCEAAGLDYLNPHRFRHGFASNLLNAGMNMSAVSAAMGHSSVTITEQVYAAWLTDGLSREYATALARLSR